MLRLLRKLGPLGRFAFLLYAAVADPPIEVLLDFIDLPNDRPLKLGLSMGTFNPIHLWHLQVAQCGWVQMALDVVIFIVNGDPPHKEGVVSKYIRYDMVRAAVKGNQRFCHSRLEVDRDGKSYTVDTLRQLKQMFESRGYTVELHLFIGMDNVNGLEKWKDAPEILAPGLCKLVIAPRFQDSMTAGEIQAHIPSRKLNVDWFMLDSPDSTVSSTLIRNWIASGKFAACADYLVSNAVRKIIARYGLYRRQ